jgi:hypothetical protein
MLDKVDFLRRTIHTPTPTMQGGETTAISHGVIIRMCKIHKGNYKIFSRGVIIRLLYK